MNYVAFPYLNLGMSLFCKSFTFPTIDRECHCLSFSPTFSIRYGECHCFGEYFISSSGLSIVDDLEDYLKYKSSYEVVTIFISVTK